jgi:hypothetical protein
LNPTSCLTYHDISVVSRARNCRPEPLVRFFVDGVSRDIVVARVVKGDDIAVEGGARRAPVHGPRLGQGVGRGERGLVLGGADKDPEKKGEIVNVLVFIRKYRVFAIKSAKCNVVDIEFSLGK